MPTVVSWLEQAQRGQYADIQWAYSFIERRDADLLSLVDRRTGAVMQMDWDIKTVEKRFKQRGLAFDSGLAGEQQAALRGQYDRFENLYVAIEALCMATFRGYAHVQFLADGNLLTDLNPLDQWNVLRDGLNGDWYWNPDGLNRGAENLPKENRMDPAAYLIRVNKRPVNEVAIIKFMRHNLSAKDWDGFLEIYGIPGWVVIMPPIPAGKEDEFQTAAEDVAEGGSGALPNGSTVECADAPRGVVPFEQHLRYWSEKLVLAGTGGLLTMLTAPGSGTLAGSAHQEAFDLLARAEARRVSEIFQRGIDRYVLGQAFPGRPALAYFELAANEEQDVGEILDHVVKISQAGGQVDWTEISEKTGYSITAAPPKPAPVMPATPAELPNRTDGSDTTHSPDRAALVSSAVDQTVDIRKKLLQPMFDRLAELAQRPGITDAEFSAAVEDAIKQLDGLITPEAIAELAKPLEGAMGQAVVGVLNQMGRCP
jgi:phage gp29-like protein